MTINKALILLFILNYVLADDSELAKKHLEQANAYVSKGQFTDAFNEYQSAIELDPNNYQIYFRRASLYLATGKMKAAVTDLDKFVELKPNSVEGRVQRANILSDFYLKNAEKHYNAGEVEGSLGQIRECLKFNPDHKACFAFYKRVKKLAKLREQLEKLINGEKWMDCLAKGNEILKFEKDVDIIQLDVFRHTCRCNREAGHIAEAIQECTEILNNADPNDLDILCERAEAYILNEQFEKAVEDYQKAVNAHEGSRKAKEGLNKAQRLLKQSQKKDYYKILGVKRSANKREILKAYRKLAQKWHPDNFQDEEEKKHAQDKFIDIAAAKDVLTDPEKRQRFDQGEDPLDPNANVHQQGWQHFQQGGGFPFHGFGGNGEHFSFKFTNF